MITAQGLRYRYADAASDALDDVSLEIAEGECIGLLGPNGAGKTTLMSLLCGLQKVQHGEIYFNGTPLARLPRKIQQKISLVPQDFAFYPLLSVWDNMRFFAALYRVWDDRYLSVLLEETGLSAYRDKLARHLSGGLKRRLNFAIGRINSPQVMFLDEITVGIDPASRKFILESVAALTRQGITVVYTSHYLQEIETLCHKIALLAQGRLRYHGALEDVLRNNQQPSLQIQIEPLLSDQDLSTVGGHRCGVGMIEIPAASAYGTPEALCAFLQEKPYAIGALHYGVPSLETFYLNFLRECAEADAGSVSHGVSLSHAVSRHYQGI